MNEKDIFDAIAKSKGRGGAQDAEVNLPFAEADAARQRAAEEARAAQEALVWKNAAIGDTMPDGTVYLGKYEEFDPKKTDAAGKPLTRVFNLYASAANLPEKMRYKNAFRAVANLRGLHGHDGRFKTRRALWRAIDRHTYRGEWFMPTFEMFGERNEKQGMAGTGGLSNTIPRYTEPYWSSSYQYSGVGPFRVNKQPLAVYVGRQPRKHLISEETLPCRPVRMVEIDGNGDPLPLKRARRKLKIRITLE